MEDKKYVCGLLDFIKNSPSSYHAVNNIATQLAGEGFKELREDECWNVEAGGKYFTVRNGSSIIAFILPDTEKIKGFHIVATHSDSPAFKVKEAAEMAVEDKYIRLNTEKYGGMIMSTWLDRPLSVAGRIAIEDENAANGISTKLVNIDRDLLVIPNVAIHMNRDMNKGVEYNPQTDMLPIYSEYTGEVSDGSFIKLLAETAGIDAKKILGHDLYLYVRDKGRIIGKNGEFILSPKLDDLQCAYASVQAFAESAPHEYINVCAVFDNEEVGSVTRQGADSTFLQDVTERIAENLNMDRNHYLAAVSGSFLISADNAHGIHPNHPEKADPVNRPKLNGGIVIKYHGSQKYTTDAVSAAVMKEICKKADVPFQVYTNRSDIAGGSTLGNISTAHVSVSSADIGLAQLAMHSAVETAGSRDTEYAVKAFKEFYGM
jgi:aspartyl aminopeptidase